MPMAGSNENPLLFCHQMKLKVQCLAKIMRHRNYVQDEISLSISSFYDHHATDFSAIVPALLQGDFDLSNNKYCILS